MPVKNCQLWEWRRLLSGLVDMLSLLFRCFHRLLLPLPPWLFQGYCWKRGTWPRSLCARHYHCLSQFLSARPQWPAGNNWLFSCWYAPTLPTDGTEQSQQRLFTDLPTMHFWCTLWLWLFVPFHHCNVMSDAELLSKAFSIFRVAIVFSFNDNQSKVIY